MTEVHIQEARSKISDARWCLGIALLGAGVIVLLIGSIRFSESRKEAVWAYEFIIKGGFGLRTFTKTISPLSLTLNLMAGASMVAGSLFVLRRNFSLRILLICVLLIGFVGSLPVYFERQPPNGVSIRCWFDQPFSSTQINSLQVQLEPNKAIATLPQKLLQELSIARGPRVQELNVQPLYARNNYGARLDFMLSPQLNEYQREALTEFYAYYFEQLCFEFAKANGSISNTTTTRPYVTGRFYKYLNEWEDLRASREKK